MKSCPILLSVLAALVLVPACSKDLSDAEGGGEAAGRGEVKIVFELPGDDFASPEDLERRDAVVAAIAEGGHGEIQSTGSGMGSMEIVVRLKGDDSIKSMKIILRRIYPEARYSIMR